MAGGRINCSDSELSTYLQALGEGYLPISCSDINQSVPSRSIPIAAKCSQLGKKMVAFPGFPSLVMSKNSTDGHGKDSSISLPAAFLVSTSPVPEKAPESKESNQDSGRSSPASLARYDLATYSWKTPQCLLFEEGTESLRDLAALGYDSTYRCHWEPMMSELHIDATEFGLSHKHYEKRTKDRTNDKGDADLEVSVMRRRDDTATVQWTLGRSDKIFTTEVLFQKMPADRADKNGSWQRSIPTTGAKIQTLLLRTLRFAEAYTNTPSGQGHNKQPGREFEDALREGLSQYIALEGSEGEWRTEAATWELFPLPTPAAPHTEETNLDCGALPMRDRTGIRQRRVDASWRTGHARINKSGLRIKWLWWNARCGRRRTLSTGTNYCWSKLRNSGRQDGRRRKRKIPNWETFI